MKPDLLLIATSTGGTIALSKVMTNISNKLDVPILIVQHMLEGFTKAFANNLDKISKINVKEASANEIIKPSYAYVAPAGFHMKIDLANRLMPKIKISNEPKVNSVRPAADVLFKNIAETYAGKNILVFVGTGMGKDGLEGIKQLKSKCNCYCITESEKTCVIYGMPKAIKEAGYSDEVVNLEFVASRINVLCEKGWR